MTPTTLSLLTSPGILCVSCRPPTSKSCYRFTKFNLEKFCLESKKKRLFPGFKMKQGSSLSYHEYVDLVYLLSPVNSLMRY